MRLPLAAALLMALGLPARAGNNADPGSSSMGSLIMGSWRQAEQEGHSNFCFTGLTVSMNEYHNARIGASENERIRLSGYYNSVTTHFKTPKLPKFSVTVHEPNGKGPTDPTFHLSNYMKHIDGDEEPGHAECIPALEVDYPRAVGIAAKLGLITSSGNSQYLELRMATSPDEPGWSDKKLRGKTYWTVIETVKSRINEYYIDALTGKPLRKRASRPDTEKPRRSAYGIVPP